MNEMQGIDWSQFDDFFKNMFTVNPRFFKGMMPDELIEEQEQLIENNIGETTHEERMGLFYMMTGEENE